MNRHSWGAVCALIATSLSACDTERPPVSAPPVDAPEVVEVAKAPPPVRQRPRNPDQDVVGRPAGSLVDTQWLQGSADLDDGPTLVVFWELWCPHCKREVPRLQQLHARDDIHVVGLTRLTRNVSPEQVGEFVRDKGVTYPIGRTTDEMAQRYGVRGIPAAALVQDGTIVWRGHPARLTDAQLDVLLGS